MTTIPILQLDSLSKYFPHSPRPAIDQLTLSLSSGDILSLLGPSGCGKTTLLRLVAGFDSPTTGSIHLDGRLVANPQRLTPPEYRNVGMVFQDYALFPHLNVIENIAFGLKNQKRQSLNSVQIKERIKDAIALVGLYGLEKRYPHQLSGGQQQRVALARALAPHPKLILMDEPLSNLDVQVRLRLREEIRHILKTSGISALFVTHDQEEALSMSDCIAVMHHGHLEQVGTPEEIYGSPASRFVAEFVSQANCFPTRRRGNLWETEIGVFPVLPHSIHPSAIEEGFMIIRQEDIRIQPDQQGKLRIHDCQFLGREHRYCLLSESGQEFHARSWTGERLAIGSLVKLSVTEERIQVFP